MFSDHPSLSAAVVRGRVFTRDAHLLACPTCGDKSFDATTLPPSAAFASGGGPGAWLGTAAGLSVEAECVRCGWTARFRGVREVEPAGRSTSPLHLGLTTSAGVLVVSTGIVAATTRAALRGAAAAQATQLLYYLVILASIVATVIAYQQSARGHGDGTTVRDFVLGTAAGGVVLAAMFTGEALRVWSLPAKREVSDLLGLYGAMVPFCCAVFTVGFASGCRSLGATPRYGQMWGQVLTWAGGASLISLALRGVFLPPAMVWRARQHVVEAAAPTFGLDVVLPALFLALFACLTLGWVLGGAARRAWLWARRAARPSADVAANAAPISPTP